jgi:fatty-acid desaturase
VGLVFAAAAVPKIAQPADFAVAIYRYQLMPHATINALAVFLPWLEMVCAAALLFVPRLRSGAFVLIILMLLVFTTAISINLYRGIDIACGCFSVNAAKGHLGWLSLVRNTALLIASAWALRATLQADDSPPKR